MCSLKDASRSMWTMPCLLNCVPLQMSNLCNRVLWTVSCLCACVLQIVSHWSSCILWMMSCRFTCAWAVTGWDVLWGRSGGTWLPGEFLAPSSWRRHSSARTGMRRPEHSEEVNKSNLRQSVWALKAFNQISYNNWFNSIQERIKRFMNQAKISFVFQIC